MKKVIVCALILAIGVPAVAFGAGEGRSLLLGKRNPTGGELTRETQVIAPTPATAPDSPTSVQAAAPSTAAAATPTTTSRASARTTSSTGRAFEFETGGKEAGEILVKDATGVPFVTNATGKVANLNADKLDDLDSADVATKAEMLFAADGGTLGGNRGATGSTRAGDATTVTFNRDVSKCSYTATANGATPEALAVASAGATGTLAGQIVVTEEAGAPAVAFHLQVIC